MASDAYWNATKPNGMPDYVWQAQQAAKKAEEAKKKANSGYTTAKDTVANTNPTSYNTAQYYAAQALQNAGQTVPKPKTPIEEYLEDVQKYSTATTIANSTPATSYNTAELEAAKAVNAARDSRIDKLNEATTPASPTVEEIVQAIVNTGLTTEDARDEKIAIKNGTIPEYAQKDNGYVPVADLNRPTNGSGVIPKPDNSGLTTDDARKEHVGIMNNPTINPTTDGQISAGAIIPSQSPTIPQETIDQINQLLKDNAPKDVIYTPTDYVGGTYTPQYPQGDGAASPVLSTSDAASQYALAIMQAAKGDLGEVVRPEYQQAVAPTSPELRTLEELAKTYGITYDYDSIYKALNESVEKQYDAIYERQKQNEAAYYDNATAAQNTLLDTLSRDRSNAVSAGVSKGMQAANALGAMLGVSQQFAGNATALSQERVNTAKDYGASLAKAVVDAEKTSNERKNAIMEIAKMLYGYDSEQYVANMDNYNTILTNNAALQQNYMNNHTALQNTLASIFNNSASSKITGDANIQANQAIAEANRYAAYQAAEAQRYAAHQAAEANKQAAATAAQGNVDAYRLYADALVQQALASRGGSSLGNFEVPTVNTGASTGTSTGTGNTNVGNSVLTKAYNAVKNYINGTVPTQAMNAANRDANAGANAVLELILSALGITK